MGYEGNIHEDMDGIRDHSLKTADLSLTGQSSTEHATFTRSEMNSNFTYCDAEVNPRQNLNLNQEPEYCYVEFNTNRQWNCKPELVESGSKIQEEINSKWPSGYEQIKNRWEFNFHRECVDPKTIIKRNDRPLSTESSIYVIPQVEENRSVNMLTDDFRRIFLDKDQNSILTLSEVPQDLSVLSVEDVGRVLRCLNMHKYVETFANELVDGRFLASLELEHLSALNVGSFHAKKLLNFIKGWRPFHEDEGTIRVS